MDVVRSGNRNYYCRPAVSTARQSILHVRGVVRQLPVIPDRAAASQFELPRGERRERYTHAEENSRRVFVYVCAGISIFYYSKTREGAALAEKREKKESCASGDPLKMHPF